MFLCLATASLAGCSRKKQDRRPVLPLQSPSKPGSIPVLCMTAGPEGDLLVGVEPRMQYSSLGPMVAKARGVHRLSKDGMLTALDSGLGTDSITAVAVTPKGTLLAGGARVMRSTDGGRKWLEADASSRFVARDFLVAKGDKVFAASHGNGVLVSLDDGEHWTPTGLTKGTVFALALHPNGHLFAATAEGLWESENHGTSWDQAGLAMETLKAIAIDARGVVYVGSAGVDAARLGTTPGEAFQAILETSGGVFASETEAVSGSAKNPRQRAIAGTSAGLPSIARVWNEAKTLADAGAPGGRAVAPVWKPMGLQKKTVWALLVLPDGTVLAGTRDQGVLARAGEAPDFAPAAGIPVGAMATSLLRIGEVVYAGTGAGVFRSSDGGRTFAVASPEL